MSIISVDYGNIGGGQVASGYEATSPSNGKITCGFKPRVIEIAFLCANVANNFLVCQYNKENSPNTYIRHTYSNNTSADTNIGDTTVVGGFTSIDDDGFTLSFGSLTYDKFQRIRWVAAE